MLKGFPLQSIFNYPVDFSINIEDSDQEIWNRVSILDKSEWMAHYKRGLSINK